jgi:hypothetical protein
MPYWDDIFGDIGRLIPFKVKGNGKASKAEDDKTKCGRGDAHRTDATSAALLERNQVAICLKNATGH